VPVTQLDMDQFHQVKAILESLEKRPPWKTDNRRRRHRLTLHLMLEAALLGPHSLPQVRLYTRNISTTGLGFLCHRNFEPGDLLAIHLTLDQPVDKLVLGQVMFSRPADAGMYESGVRFEDAVIFERPVRVPRAWVKRANLRRE